MSSAPAHVGDRTDYFNITQVPRRPCQMLGEQAIRMGPSNHSQISYIWQWAGAAAAETKRPREAIISRKWNQLRIEFWSRPIVSFALRAIPFVFMGKSQAGEGMEWRLVGHAWRLWHKHISHLIRQIREKIREILFFNKFIAYFHERQRIT